MKSLFDSAARQSIFDRIDRLTAENRPLWGTMDVSRMICHASDQLRAALGELATDSGSGLYTLPPVRWLVINVIPWPKGLPTAPVLLSTHPDDLARDKTTLKDLIIRFSEEGLDYDWSAHPLFGKLPGKQWGRLAYRHLDHHLRQFGV